LAAFLKNPCQKDLENYRGMIITIIRKEFAMRYWIFVFGFIVGSFSQILFFYVVKFLLGV
jgi:hypothetical protein